MEQSLALLRQIVPDMLDICVQRYELLRHIHAAQPIGRRVLAQKLNASERVVRSQVEVLRSLGLVDFTSLGISLTAAGERILPQLAGCFLCLKGMKEVRQELLEKLPLSEVVIVPGNSDADETVQAELGRQAAQLLAKRLEPGMTVAVSGGTTMEKTASQLVSRKVPISVVPARGGIGERVECQANMIAAVIAEKTGGVYHMIHIPDGVTGATLQALLDNEPHTLEVAHMAEHADIVLFGIGRSDIMAEKRQTSEGLRQELERRHSCGEALGCYCDLNGHIVHTTNNVGLSVEKLKQIKTVIAVAGGASKAEAIIAVLRAAQTGILITDETAAAAMKRILG